MDVRVSSDPAGAAAAFVAQRLRSAHALRQAATVAFSGGSTAPAMIDALLDSGRSGEIPWGDVQVFQVDERIAPDGDPDRNASQLDSLPATVQPMPVTDDDVESAALRYGSSIADPLDVVHLGIGPDGHTASWVPRPHPDARRALESSQAAFIVGEYQGRRRMTLGPTLVNGAGCRVVLATGASKAPVIAQWVEESNERGGAWGDTDLPIAAVEPDDTFVFLDAAAASVLDRSSYIVVDGRGRPLDDHNGSGTLRSDD